MQSAKSRTGSVTVPRAKIYLWRAVAYSVAALIVLLVWLVGSVDRSQIAVYTVAKTEAIAQQNRQRVMGAIVPRQPDAWFFKLTGPDRHVAQLREAFNTFLGSVSFKRGRFQPTWTLPEGWHQLPEFAPQNMGQFKRFATVQIPVGTRLAELAVTRLPMPANASGGGPDDPAVKDYLLSNINRWRRQLGLAPIQAKEMDQQTRQVKLNGGTAFVVELVGQRAATSGRAPFAHPPMAGGGRPVSSGPGELRFEVPEGWKPARGSSLSRYAFAVEQDGRQARVTVTPLGAAAAAVLPNVNRWRGQVQLDPIGPEELQQQVQSIKLGDTRGQLVNLYGPNQAILGAIVVHGQTAWFFKLMGDTQLARQQEEQFKQFVESVRFGD